VRRLRQIGKPHLQPRIETIKASNDRIQQSIEALERKEKMWDDTKEKNIENTLENRRLWFETIYQKYIKN
jgi:hypothetical protein